MATVVPTWGGRLVLVAGDLLQREMMGIGGNPSRAQNSAPREHHARCDRTTQRCAETPALSASRLGERHPKGRALAGLRTGDSVELGACSEVALKTTGNDMFTFFKSALTRRRSGS